MRERKNISKLRSVNRWSPLTRIRDRSPAIEPWSCPTTEPVPLNGRLTYNGAKRTSAFNADYRYCKNDRSIISKWIFKRQRTTHQRKRKSRKRSIDWCNTVKEKRLLFVIIIAWENNCDRSSIFIISTATMLVIMIIFAKNLQYQKKYIIEKIYNWHRKWQIILKLW